MHDQEINRHVRYNVAVNVLDGSFFGAALGLASFVTIIPLFVSTLTDSAMLIGLISAIHAMGWQLPQLMIARRVAQLRRYKPMVLLMSLHERIPFLGLALVAWFAASMGKNVALLLTFVLLIWQGLGGGFTAPAWQSMIGKIMPVNRRGTFYGLQSAAANLLASGGAVLAGFLLEALASPLDFTLCFALAGFAMMISWLFLARTREPDREPETAPATQRDFWRGIKTILKRDHNFRWFVAARILSQMAIMASAFFSIYAIQSFGMGAKMAGLLTGVFLITQTLANPLMGWIGDHFSHRLVMEVGALAALAAAAGAWLAPTLGWFYLIFALAGVANVAFWTVALAMTLDFGSIAERPAYIGLANTLVAPATLLAPLLGGWLADNLDYSATFITATAGSLITWLILRFRVRDSHANQAGLEQRPVLVVSAD